MKRSVPDKTAFLRVGVGDPRFVCSRAWACNHTFLSPQTKHFGRFYQVIAPDFWGPRRERRSATGLHETRIRTSHASAEARSALSDTATTVSGLFKERQCHRDTQYTGTFGGKE
jgi:hypothetical protein